MPEEQEERGRARERERGGGRKMHAGSTEKPVFSKTELRLCTCSHAPLCTKMPAAANMSRAARVCTVSGPFATLGYIGGTLAHSLYVPKHTGTSAPPTLRANVSPSPSRLRSRDAAVTHCCTRIGSRLFSGTRRPPGHRSLISSTNVKVVDIAGRRKVRESYEETGFPVVERDPRGVAARLLVGA